ncbi:MAG: S8 family serine peptidase, partial [Phycisphaerae bacterium]|nr:S8 family serine peptidase [Phycisphaerae bacterium]
MLMMGLYALLTSTASAVNLAQHAPAFSLVTIQGEPIKINDDRDRNVLLFFGTSWCDNTKKAIPTLNKIHRDIPQTDLKVIFIAPHQHPEELLVFAKTNAITCSIVPDPTGIISTKYRVSRVPICLFIDAKGIVQYKGPLTTETIWQLMAGEKIVSPTNAQNRFRQPQNKSTDPLKSKDKLRRVIVELDEPPTHAKHLAKKAIHKRQSQLTAHTRKIGGRIIHNYGKWKNKIVVEIDEDKLELLSSLPKFKSVKEDVKVRALLEDSVYQIKADYAWSNAITGAGILVGVIDTGIDTNHPDLQNVVVNQYDFFNDTSDVIDDNGHGTHVAGIIASQGLTYRGVSFDVGLLGAKVLNGSGEGYASDVIQGIQWCVDQGADVINLSLGEGLFTETCDQLEMAQAVNDAVDAGVVVICASGNDGNPNQIVSPACASKAIAVGAVDKADGIASYSDGGVELDLVAPGGDTFGGTHFPEIASTFSTIVANDPYLCMYYVGEQCYDDYFLAEGNRYIRAVGTSMAAPHVAGAAALLLERNPSLTPQDIKSILQDNADDLGAPGWDNIYGWGRINIERALDNLPTQPSELNITITDPNAIRTVALGQEFPLNVQVNCLGGDGCGEVQVLAQYHPGSQGDDYLNISPTTDLSTTDQNPVTLGALSGYTFETEVPVVFDVHTTLDISDNITTKQTGMTTSPIGSTLLSDYHTGDLEPGDALGAISENVEQIYSFDIPNGMVKKMTVQMENYMVIHFDDPLSQWQVYTANPAGDSLHFVADYTP